MKQALAVLIAALTLSGCAEYGYVYDYGPGGPRGHYTGPFEHPRVRSGLTCARAIYSGPYYNGYGEPYYAGPYCADAAGRPLGAIAPPPG